MAIVRPNFHKKRDDIILPTMSYNDRQAGIDFFSPCDISIESGESDVINLLVGWNPEFIGFGEVIKFFFKIYMQLKARSGHAFNNRLEITSAGVVDMDWKGDISIILYNKGKRRIDLKIGDKICQGVIMLLPKTDLGDQKIKNEEVRGSRGFGSSDKEK